MPPCATIEAVVCTNGRVLKQEWLDSAGAAAVARNLRDLARLNRWLGPARILTRLVAHHTPPGRPFRVLDIGAASGDLGDALRRTFPAAEVVSLDHRASHLQRAAPPRVAADAFRLPFAPRSFDIVTSSLVLHHYREEQIAALLAHWRTLVRRAVIVLELERHPLAYYFLPATRWLLRWHEITVHDGCASVEAAFRPAELAALGGSGAVVRRHLPWFRISLVLPAGT